MQTIPPQKPGFHGLTDKDRAFTNWHSFGDYTSKLGCLNDFLERKDAVVRRQRYKEELDSLMRLKLSREQTEKEREREYMRDRQADLALARQEEAALGRQMAEFERKRQASCLVDVQQRNEAVKEQNKADNLKRARELEENKKIIELDEVQRKAKKAIIAEEFKQNYAQEMESKQAQKKREREDDHKFALSEQYMLQKQEEKNREFLMKLKSGWKQNSEIVAIYEKLYLDKEARKKAMEYQTVERPYLERLRGDLEREEKELRCRAELKKEKNEFLLKQIEHNRIKKQLLTFEEAVLDNEKLQQDLDSKNTQDRLQKESHRKRLEENLRILRHQIEENRRVLMEGDTMNQAEADINNSAPVKIDYVHPSDDVICGLPGIGISHDRRAQLDALDRNLALNDVALAKSETPNYAEPRKNDPHSTAAMARLLHTIKDQNLLANEDLKSTGTQRLSLLAEKAQRIQEEKKLASEPAKENALRFRNEYDMIRFKNKNNKFNIISNQINNLH